MCIGVDLRVACLHFNGTKTNYCTFTVVRDKNDDVIVFAIMTVISSVGGKYA